MIKSSGPSPTPRKVLYVLKGLGRFERGNTVVNDTPVQHWVEPPMDVTIINHLGHLIQ